MPIFLLMDKSRGNKFIFIHVPKTAGSMFRNIVNQNFGKEAKEDSTLYSEMTYSMEQIDRLFYLYPFRFFLGHTFCLKSSLLAQNGQINLIAFVRNPVEKALSAYYYLRNREMTNSDHPVKQKTFVEMVEYVSEMKYFDSFDLDSSQLDWLVGQKDAEISQVEAAISSKRLFLFPTDKFDLACVMLERLFPEDFKDCSYQTRINVSSKDKEIKEAELRAAETLPWIEKDKRLHNLALGNLDTLSAESFLSENQLNKELEGFRERCNQKKKLIITEPSTTPSILKRLINRFNN